MRRLAVLVTIAAAAQAGCGPLREGIVREEPAVPESLAPGLPPITADVNRGPFPPSYHAAAARKPIRTAGFQPGINGKGPIGPPGVEDAATPEPPPPAVARATVPAVPETADAFPVPPPPRDSSGPPEADQAQEQPVRDAEVARTSAAAPRAREPEPPIGATVGEWAARVDNDVITWNELQSTVGERLSELPEQQRAMPEVRALVASSVLDHLIDRSLIIQRARRAEFKDPKHWELINKGAVATFEAEQLPALIQRYQAKDRYDLERILEDRGRSLDEIVSAFKLEFVYQQYLMAKVGSKIHVDLPEMRSYYFEHRDHDAFHQGPQITWREVVVRNANHAEPGAARLKAEQARARIAGGEKFEAVARDLSEGVNADQGGLWVTAPGSYAVEDVNAALETLRPSQIAPLIEEPSGFHVVRLDERQAGGQKGFGAVQQEIREILHAEKQEEIIREYIEDLYRGAVVTTVFNEYVPRHLRGEDDKGSARPR